MKFTDFLPKKVNILGMSKNSELKKQKLCTKRELIKIKAKHKKNY